MLSFDITDRNVRVVKGVENSGKIKISSAATLNLDEELIVNGHVKDVPNVATLINGVLKKNRMPDKEAIVSISSNYTIFKELNVVKGKNTDMSKAIKEQVVAELNLDIDTYCVTYIIVGETEEKSASGDPIVKVLATACPYDIINSYRDVFKLLGISLRSLMIACNCITKVLLADTKIKSKMPLLAVQIDNNFISLNLYEDSQLAFSRFASIDPSDYGNSEDYVFQAVNENIFRMLQFQRSRNTGEIVENIVFYGDTHDYAKLTEELEKMELKTSLINVPPQIHGHENLEFSLYANAIGAMFKRNKDTEKINLLENELGGGVMSRRASSAKSDEQGLIVAGITVAAAALIVGGVWCVQSIRDKSIQNKIQEIDDFMNDPQTLKQLNHQTKLLGMKDLVNNYYTMVVNANDAFLSQPVIDGEKYETFQEVLDLTASQLGISEARISTPSYADGTFSFNVTANASDEMIQELPAKYIQNLIDPEVKENKGFYYSATYNGYSITEKSDEGAAKESATVNFSTTVQMYGRQSAYQPEEEDIVSEETDDTGSEE